MAIAIKMPKQGQSVETCIITKWFREKGENVSAGDILLSYETDKATFDLESPEDGILLDVFFGDGAEVPVLVNVAVIGKAGETYEQFNSGHPKASPESTTASDTTESARLNPDEFPETSESQNNITVSGTIRISPRARSLAIANSINFEFIKGTGPNGRIITSDIEKALTGSESSSNPISSTLAEYTEKPLSNVRKLIAKAMHSSLQNSAQLTHHMSADVRLILEARRKIKDDISSGKNQQDITLNDLICWCVIRALKKFPEVNSHLLGDNLKTYNKVHLGIAVDTPRGLMVPAIINADDMDLAQLSKELKILADACRKGSINPELIQSTSATFTVSNLGNYGVEIFTPVINLPQAGILGVCSIINRPANMGNNIFGFVPYIGLSLTYDHRAIDGGPATMFLREIRKQIEGFKV